MGNCYSTKNTLELHDIVPFEMKILHEEIYVCAYSKKFKGHLKFSFKKENNWKNICDEIRKIINNFDSESMSLSEFYNKQKKITVEIIDPIVCCLKFSKNVDLKNSSFETRKIIVNNHEWQKFLNN